MSLVNVGVDGFQKNISRLKFAEVSSEVSLHGVNDVLPLGFFLSFCYFGADHFDEAVKVPKAEIFSLLFLVDLVVASGQINDEGFHQAQSVIVV